ncbi:hypothetical protein [Methylobacterium oryzae]|uniref:hypothetical protein n=1 Tax=Methylobacterium oryzae TaxID=334852 RepID=UPI002F2F8D42
MGRLKKMTQIEIWTIGGIITGTLSALSAPEFGVGIALIIMYTIAFYLIGIVVDAILSWWKELGER